MGDSILHAGILFGISKLDKSVQVASEVYAIDSRNIYTTRVDNFVQRAGPSSIGDITGKVFGHGTYDGHSITLKKVEYATSYGGVYTELTPLTGDPSYSFPATATEAGASFTIPVEPDEWVASSIWIRVTVTFVAVGDSVDTGGSFAWDTNIPVAAPASIVVPTSDSDGSFQVSWALVDGATGYQIEEGVGDTLAAVVWSGSLVDAGDVSQYNVSGKAAGFTYWYRVRAYNPRPNYSSWTTSSNGCLVERPSIKISPDLGWANKDAMLRSSSNQRLAEFPLDDLQVVLETPTGVKTPQTLYFDVAGTVYQVPPTGLGKIGPSGKYWWTGTGNDSVEQFTLVTGALLAGGVPAVPEIKRVQLKVLS